MRLVPRSLLGQLALLILGAFLAAQAISIWLGFFPVNLAFTLLAVAFVPGWDDLWTLAWVFITTIVLTPIMAYWVLPFVTRALQPWLNRAG